MSTYFSNFKMGSCGLSDGVISLGGLYLGENGLETNLRISRDIDNGHDQQNSQKENFYLYIYIYP